MRVVALVAVVAVLVASGFWLARDRDADTPEAASTTTSAVASDTAPVSEPAVDTAVDTVAEPADEPEAADTDAAPDAPSDEPAEEPTEEQDGEESGPATEPDADDGSEPSDADDAPAETELDLATLLPVGYAQVEFLADEPRRSFTAAEQVLEDGFDYVALLHTNRGDIVVDLYEELTPVTVNNFVFLTLNRFYQGVPFHRVLEDFMAQTGDPTGTGSGGPGYQFEDEIVDGVVFDSVGQLAMANAGPGTNGSQFFITFAATPWLTGAHTIFGEVMSGVEVLDAITRVDPSNPSAVVMPSDTLADLAAAGIELPGDADTTVEEALEAILGTSPVLGQSFTAAGYRGVMGQLGADPAYGFFSQPDTLLDVVIGARATQ